MSIHTYTYITCDHPKCKAPGQQRTIDYRSKAAAPVYANRAGWDLQKKAGRQDWCPRCVARVKDARAKGPKKAQETA